VASSLRHNPGTSTWNERSELGAVNGGVVEQRAEPGCGEPLNDEMPISTCYMPSSETVTAFAINEDGLVRHGPVSRGFRFKDQDAGFVVFLGEQH